MSSNDHNRGFASQEGDYNITNEFNRKRMVSGDPELSKRQKTGELLSQDDLDVLLHANISSVSSIEGTPEVEMIINHADNQTNRQIPRSQPTLKQQSDRNTAPDVVKAYQFLDEKYDELKEIRLSQKLLKKKQAEDNGTQIESDSEGEDFEDLLELFGIDPDEISLDLNMNERQKLLMDSMDDEQQTRYETFRRSNLNINGIRKLVNGATGINVPNDFAKIIAGVGKVFVGQIVERAKDAQRREAETKVTLQLKYIEELEDYERRVSLGESDIKKPMPPTFYDALLQAETNTNSNSKKEYTSSTFKVIIPRESMQLTPDHIREAWLQYVSEGEGSLNGRWRQEGGGSGTLFR